MLRKNLNRVIKQGDIRKDSLLLTLGDCYQKMKEDLIIDPFDKEAVTNSYYPIVRNWDSTIIGVNELILFASKEEIMLSKNVYGLMSTLSHVARLGLMSQPSSFFFDPGFKGYITFELYNLSKSRIKLSRGMAIAKLVFFKCDDKVQNKSVNSEKIFYGEKQNLISRYYDEFKNKDCE